MEGDEGEGFKKPSLLSTGEVDFKTKAGTAWSHSFLNQKPWHPLSYPNQRRKWIAEQTHAQKERRAEEVAREYAQEQDFLRQTALISKKEKEKLEMMKAVSFMYVKPPGYNAESAKAAEVAEEKKTQDQGREVHGSQDLSLDGASTSKKMEGEPPAPEKRKSRPKDIYGRALPTEEDFEVLKNAPRLETGVAARSKPFAVEIRNVKCLRCGKYGHQSGDRECPLKDAIMPNEENRLKRDDPLTAILAQAETSEPLRWELKQKPGMSPPRGGFKADDPNQQIVAEEIFDEYGGFLGEINIPELLTNISSSKSKKKSSKDRHKKSVPASSEVYDQDREPSSGDEKRRSRKDRHKKKSVPASSEVYDQDREPSSGDEKRRLRKKNKRTRPKHSESSSSENSEDGRRRTKSYRRKHRHSNSSEVSDSDEPHKSKHSRRRHRHRSKSPEDPDSDEPHKSKHSRRHHHHHHSDYPEDPNLDEPRKSKHSHRHHHHRSYSPEDPGSAEPHKSKHSRHHRHHYY